MDSPSLFRVGNASTDCDRNGETFKHSKKYTFQINEMSVWYRFLTNTLDREI